MRYSQSFQAIRAKYCIPSKILFIEFLAHGFLRHDKALSHFVATNPEDGNECSIIQLAKYNQVSNRKVFAFASHE